MRKVLFEPLALKQFKEWKRSDKKVLRKIATLIAEARDEPYKGTGKPERLRRNLKGYWSLPTGQAGRRITKEHRLVYKVTDESIIVIACKYHY